MKQEAEVLINTFRVTGKMKALRTISGTVLLLIAGFLKMTFSIMQTHLRQVTLKEQLTANYPVNQVNDVIETYATAIPWLFFCYWRIATMADYLWLRKRANQTFVL